MSIHELSVGDRVLWQAAFDKPQLGEIKATDGFGEGGEPFYLVELQDLVGWFPLGESVLRAQPRVEVAFPMAPLIGVTGRKRTGKDTIATELVRGYEFERLAFADLLKDLALDINPIVGSRPLRPAEDYRLVDLVDNVGWERAKEWSEVRRFLQVLGGRARVRLGDRIWVDRVLTQAHTLRQLGIPIVITDVRYANEAQAIKDAGGTLIKVVRPSLEITDNHPSEAGPDSIEADFLITNDRDLEWFQREVHYVADALNLQDLILAADAA